MSPESLLTWIVVGLVAGGLAALVVGGIGWVGDLVIGVVGAFVGGAIFRALHWSAPFHGLAGVISVAFVGAVASLLVLHLVTGRRRSRSAP